MVAAGAADRGSRMVDPQVRRRSFRRPSRTPAGVDGGADRPAEIRVGPWRVVAGPAGRRTMTEDDRIDRVRALLIQAESAHAEYEATALQGVYDQEWPRWYAAYAVEHGIGAIVGRSVTTDRLAEFLASTN